MARTNNKDVHRGVVLYLDGKQVAANATQIRAEMKKVKQEIDKMTVGSEEYIRATKRYRELDAVLQQHKAKLKAVEVQQQSLLSKGVKFFKDYSLQITGAITALTGVAIKINQFRKQAAEQEDAAANLKALTGLDDSNIQWLEQQAEKLSTTMEASGLRVRKSVKEILEAYMLVGSKKPELLQDKEALNAVTIEAMRLAEAAKMELKDAVNGVTLAMNQYGAAADEASRYVNVLAAGSKYGAVGVATQTESIVKAGVAANMAKVPIEQLVGVLETLGERGIEGQIAGTQLKTFFLKLEAGAKETRPSVVGLQQALETLAAKNLSVTELTKMFGMESISTAQALITSADKVKQYTEAVTGTSTAIEQARINSDTTAARMAQIRNQINLTGQALAKDLAPILSKTVNWTNKFVMAMPVMIDYLKKYGLSTAALLTTLAIYNSYTTIATKATAAWNAVISFAKTQITGYRASMVAYREALTGSTTAQVAMTNAVKGTNIVTQAGVVVVGLLKAAYFALTLQTAACARTLKMVKIALAESGFGLAIIAIGAAVAAIMRHNEKMKEARRLAEEQRKAERELYKEYDEAAARIRRLRKVAEDNNTSLEERKRAIEELQKLAPDYQASISEEGRLIEQNKEKLDEYLKRLKASIALEAYKSKMTELLQKQAEAEEDQQKASEKYWKTRQQNTFQGYNRNGALAGLMRLFGLEAEDNARKAVDKADKAVNDINKEIDETEQRMKELAEKWNFSLVDEEGGTGGSGSGGAGGGGGNGGGSTDPKNAADHQKEIREAIAAVDLEYDAKANELKRKYLEGEIETAEEYADKMQKLELERLNKQMAIAGLEPAQREAIQSKIYDLSLKMKNELLKLEEKQKQEAEKAAEERVRLSKEEMDAMLLEMRKQHVDGEVSEKDYNRRIYELKKAYYLRALQNQNLSAEKRKQIEREYSLFEVEEAEKRKQDREKESLEEVEAFKDKYEKIKGIIDDVGGEIEDLVEGLMKKEEDAWKNFGKGLLKILVNTLKKMALAYIAEVQMKNLAKYGIKGLALAAAETVAIEAAAGALNGLISGYAKGGYTGTGRPDEPRGIVHAGEFVANRYAVANDAVRPVLDLIDQAQKNGSIANLTAEQIAAVARPSVAPAPAATVPVASASGSPARDPELTAAIRLLTRTTARAAEAYQEPSQAYCFVEGRGSINEAQALLSKMKSNASRKS